MKSLRAVPLEVGSIDGNGLFNDRRFMLVTPRPPPLLGAFGPEDATHQFVTQRQIPSLATVQASAPKRDGITFSSHLVKDQKLVIKPKQNVSPLYKARIWSDVTIVADMGDEAADFFSKVVAKDKDAPPNASKIRLVSMKGDDRRADAKYTPTSALSWTGAAPKVGLTDGFPVLIANEASLDELNRRLKEKNKEPIPMSRFRPNIVVSGAKPFEEDTWKIVSIGGVVFHIVKGCPRCKQSCTDQFSGIVSEEPLETLAEFRALGPVKENVYFAQNAIAHDTGGIIRKGAAIHVLERGNPVWDS